VFVQVEMEVHQSNILDSVHQASSMDRMHPRRGGDSSESVQPADRCEGMVFIDDVMPEGGPLGGAGSFERLAKQRQGSFLVKR
jgi:hypothetical protein